MRHLKDITEEELQSVLSKYVFEENTPETRNAVKTEIEQLLNNKIRLEDDTTPEEQNTGRVSVVTNDGHRLTIFPSGITSPNGFTNI